MARSLNRVELIGNLTRDPELRYTPQGTAVCTFGIATNRDWKTDSGEKREDVEFHRIVAWNKLAELCSQLLTKGRKVFVEGRIATRSWTGQDGAQRTTTEIVIHDMLILDSRKDAGSEDLTADFTPEHTDEEPPTEEKESTGQQASSREPAKNDKKENKETKEEVNPDDIPF
jgi:single-strand DNA-binding protein